MKVFPHFSHVNDFFSENEGCTGETEVRPTRQTRSDGNLARVPTFVQIHVLLQGVFGGERSGADGTHKWLLPRVNALVGHQRVLLGERLAANLTTERLLSWRREQQVNNIQVDFSQLKKKQTIALIIIIMMMHRIPV